MGYLYARGGRIWIGYVDADGTRRQATTGLSVGHEDEASKVLAEVERRIAASRKLLGPDASTVSGFATKWIADRKAMGVGSAADDEARLRLHALPIIGSMRLAEVKTRHIRDLVRKLRTTDLAPRTVRHVFGVLHTMFHDAVVDELVPGNPCVLRKGDLPAKVDADPDWRRGAVFTRGELETLISDERIPWDRRVLYALMGLAGLRFGEAAALRWRHLDRDAEPLALLSVAGSYSTKGRREKSTKTERPRSVPVHPVLAKVLASWRMTGWCALLGRVPGDEDLMVPSRRGANRNANLGLKRFHEDLDRLGMRRRRQHDLRRTFITLARTDLARKDLLTTVTHGGRGDIVDEYSSLPWSAYCAEVAKLRIELGEGVVIPLRKASGISASDLQPADSVPIHVAASAVAWRGGRDLNPRPPA